MLIVVAPKVDLKGGMSLNHLDNSRAYNSLSREPLAGGEGSVRLTFLYLLVAIILIVVAPKIDLKGIVCL